MRCARNCFAVYKHPLRVDKGVNPYVGICPGLFLIVKMKKVKLPHKSEVEIKPTGEKHNNPGFMSHNMPLYAVWHIKEQRILYPTETDILHIGFISRCETWVSENCVWHGDKLYHKTNLIKLIKLDEGESLESLVIAQNNLKYDGNRHNDFNLVFSDTQVFYSFPYYSDELGNLDIGRLGRKDPCNLDKKNYLCRRVYPHKKVIVVREFKREKH